MMRSCLAILSTVGLLAACSGRKNPGGQQSARDAAPGACVHDPESCPGACDPQGYCEKDHGWGPEVRVPAGSYVVSVEPPGALREQALITFPDSYWIAKREVSIADVRRCDGCEAVAPALADDQPATFTRAEAVAFCEATGRRLPTNSEWEAAGRGPSTCADPEQVKMVEGVGTCNDRPFPWGEGDEVRCETGPDCLLCTRAHTSECVEQTGPRPVAPHPEGASPLGVEEMIGNVGEWIDETRTVPDIVTLVPVEEGAQKGGDWRLMGELEGWLAPNLTLSARMWVAINSPHDVDRAGVRCVRGAPMDVQPRRKRRP